MTGDVVLTLDANRIGLILAQSMLEGLDRYNIGAYKAKVVLINRTPAAASLNRQDIENTLQHTMICSIPPVPDLAYESAQNGRPMVLIQPRSLVAQQIRLLIQTIVGKVEP
jgi:Flp pilus assembly CpaE family ATPase